MQNFIYGSSCGERIQTNRFPRNYHYKKLHEARGLAMSALEKIGLNYKAYSDYMPNELSI